MSPQIMNVEHSARLLFIGLITQADDEGRGTADPRRLKASIFGGDDITSSNVRRWLDDLSQQNLVVLYETVSHGLLYELPSWGSHQKIDRPRKSGYPPPDDKAKQLPVREVVVEVSTSERRGLVGDRIGSEGSLGSDRIGSYGSSARESSTNGEHGKPQAPNGAVADGESRIAVPTRSDSRGQLPEDFDHMAALKGLYPSFAGNQADWTLAERACLQRLQEGSTWEELEAGARRFATFVAAGGRSGPQFVDLPSKFFGNGLWKQHWTPPASKAEARLHSNLDAAAEAKRQIFGASDVGK
jgi:hypothetical protein